MRVKILFQKKSSALVQMHDGNQAQLGIYTNHTLTGCRQNGPPLPPKRPAVVTSPHTDTHKSV